LIQLVNYTDADHPKQQAYDTAVTQAEGITNANGSNADEYEAKARFAASLAFATLLSPFKLFLA
jgi:hypothetical protein